MKHRIEQAKELLKIVLKAKGDVEVLSDGTEVELLEMFAEDYKKLVDFLTKVSS